MLNLQARTQAATVNKASLAFVLILSALMAVTSLSTDIYPRLFERFYRADASRTRSDTHHGLGLSIVRAVAIMHRGEVFARSEEGMNTFGLTFAMQTDPQPLARCPTDKIVREASV